MSKILKKEKLIYFLEYLEGKYEIFAPAKHEKHECAYAKVTASSFTHSGALTPEGPKRFIFPAESEMLKAPNLRKKVVFGARYADLDGVSLFDRAFEKPFYDEEYFRVRNEYIIVGMDHFSAPKAGYDLYLQIADDCFVATAGTAMGKYLLSLKYFDETAKSFERVDFHKDPILSHPRLAEAIEKSRDSKVWDDLAKKCLGCGICSFVCPACYCFDVRDGFDLKGNAKRTRTWDSCILPNFAEVAGNHNFRPELKNRLYNWYYHKFVRMPKELGRLGCVGCARCITYCPARINYLETLEALIKELEGKRGKKPVLTVRR